MQPFLERQTHINNRLAEINTRLAGIAYSLRGVVDPKKDPEVRSLPDGTLNQLEIWQDGTRFQLDELESSLAFLESCLLPQPPVPTQSGGANGRNY